MGRCAAAYGACLVFQCLPTLFGSRALAVVLVELPLLRIVDGPGKVSFETFGTVGRGEGGVG